jgi:phosphatidylglycerophosphatase A
MNRYIRVLASGFGAGYSPLASGTMGTVVAVPLYIALSLIPSPVYELTLVAFFFLSVWASDSAQLYWGKKDDRRIVIDEIMGFFVTMIRIPTTTGFLFAAFFLFRFFDVLKPPPLRRLERVRGGFGVVLDDVGAGIIANIVLQIAQIWIKV